MSIKKQKYLLPVKTVILISVCLLTYCSDPRPTTPLLYPNELQGQVYNYSHPGPIPVGWVPPPYENECTIVVLDINRNIVTESATDNKGRFRIILPDGTYYLRVKESPVQTETGPYLLKNGQTLIVEANFENGMV